MFFRIDELRDCIGKLIHQHLALIAAHFFNRRRHITRLGKIDRLAHIFLFAFDQRADLLNPRILQRALVCQGFEVGKRLVDAQNRVAIQIKISLIQRQKIAATAHLDIAGKARNLVDLLAQGIIAGNIDDLMIDPGRQKQRHDGRQQHKAERNDNRNRLR